MRTLLASLALISTLATASLAQSITPGGGIGQPLPRCSAVQPVCQSRCNSVASTCKQASGTTPTCDERRTACLKRCLAIQCIR